MLAPTVLPGLRVTDIRYVIVGTTLLMCAFLTVKVTVAVTVVLTGAGVQSDVYCTAVVLERSRISSPGEQRVSRLGPTPEEQLH